MGTTPRSPALPENVLSLMAGVMGPAVRSPALPEDVLYLMAGVVGPAAHSPALPEYVLYLMAGVVGRGGGGGVTSAWSPLGNFMKGQAHPVIETDIFLDVFCKIFVHSICVFFIIFFSLC